MGLQNRVAEGINWTGEKSETVRHQGHPPHHFPESQEGQHTPRRDAEDHAEITPNTKSPSPKLSPTTQETGNHCNRDFLTSVQCVNSFPSHRGHVEIYRS